MSDPKWVKTECGDVDPGSLLGIYRAEKRARKTGHCEVSCGSCNACCRSPELHAELFTPDELERFDHVMHETLGPVLPKREDGSCVHLIDGKCSVYSERPLSCRKYDCRTLLIIGYSPDNDPVIEQALKRWARVRTPIVDDEIMSVAIRMAVADGGYPSDIPIALEKAKGAYKYMKAAREMRTWIKTTPEGKRYAKQGGVE